MNGEACFGVVSHCRGLVGLVRTIRSMDVEMSTSARDLLYSKNGLLSPSCAAISLTLCGVKAMDSWTLAQAASPALMQHIGQFLIKLNLGGNALSGDIPDAIGDHCINIEWIYLARSPRITGSIPENWSKLRKLRQVHLFDTAVSGSIPAAFFGGATALREIDFSKTQLSGEIPSSIGQLTHLIDFRLFGSKVSGKIPTSMRNLKHMQRIFMGDTDLIVPEGARGLDHSNAAACAAFLALL